eukprot:14098574-Alexandrium_andersonii.AAC.1
MCVFVAVLGLVAMLVLVLVLVLGSAAVDRGPLLSPFPRNPGGSASWVRSGVEASVLASLHGR